MLTLNIKLSVILPAKTWVYSGIAENCNLQQANHSKTIVSPENEGEEHSFMEERGDTGEADINLRSFGVNWCWKDNSFSLAELWLSLFGRATARNRRNLLSFCWDSKVVSTCKVYSFWVCNWQMVLDPRAPAGLATPISMRFPFIHVHGCLVDVQVGSWISFEFRREILSWSFKDVLDPITSLP